MAEPDWNDRAVPILETVHSAEERGERPGADELAAATGLDRDVIVRTVDALVKAGYLSGVDVSAFGQVFDEYVSLQLLERGRREIGQWPPGTADAFVQALDRLIASEQDPDERSKLARLRDAAADVSKGVLAGAVVAAGQTALQGGL